MSRLTVRLLVSLTRGEDLRIAVFELSIHVVLPHRFLVLLIFSTRRLYILNVIGVPAVATFLCVPYLLSSLAAFDHHVQQNPTESLQHRV